MTTVLSLSQPLDQPERLICPCGCDHWKINLEGSMQESRSVNSVECEACHEIYAVDVALQFTLAVRDVLAERERQVTAEGFTSDHDDQHADGELAFAASCYASHAARSDRVRAVHESKRALPENWPWGERWFKPKDRRRDLVRAAALLVAEIERLDRASAKGDAS